MRLKVVLEPSTDGHTVYVPSLPGFTSLGHFLTPSGRPVDRWEE